MNFEFEKILDLIQRTGDRVIVFDKFEPSKSYVVMNIDEYERLNEDSCCQEPWDKSWKDECYEDGEEDWKDYCCEGEENDMDDIFAPVSDKKDGYFEDNDLEIPNIPEFNEGNDYLESNNEVDSMSEDDDFLPSFSENNEIANNIDNLPDYGTMEQSEIRKSNKWSIPSEIKESIDNEVTSPEEDRYYLETI